MKLIDGIATSKKICTLLANDVKQCSSPVCLAIVLVGDNVASSIYVKKKIQKCEEIGIRAVLYHFDTTITEEELSRQVMDIGQRPSINGMMVQLPLPQHLNTQKIINYIPIAKDVDGMTAANLGRICTNDDRAIIPATPLGILMLLKDYGIVTQGKHCVIVGRSHIVGRPLSMILSNTQYNATVTLCHSKSDELMKHCQSADILICAIGRPKFFTSLFIKRDSIVIDVGINRSSDTKIIGDVDFESVRDQCKAITPVPGGVGPMTIVALMYNTLKVSRLQHP